MREDELLRVVLEKNAEQANPIDIEIFKQILSIVMMNPIEKDRGTSQAQIDLIINQYIMRVS